MKARGLLPIVVLVAGCNTGPPASAVVVSADEIGVLDQSDAIQGRDGGESARVFARSVWVFGDTVLNVPDVDGENWHHNSFSFTDDVAAADGIGPLVERGDASGAPTYLLAPTADETAFNVAHRGQVCAEAPCGARFAVWPGAPVWDEARHRAIIPYGLVYAETGSFNFHTVGASFAVWTDFEAAPERPEVSFGAEHPTMMWSEHERAPEQAPLIVGDDLFAFECRDAGLSRPCVLWSAPLERMLEKDAWRVWDGAAWVHGADDAKNLFDGAPIMSVEWNDFLGAWVALYARSLADEVVLRTATDLTGPWSGELHLFDTDHGASGSWTYDAVSHAEFAEDGGRVLYVTYSRPTGETWFSAVFPIVRVELKAGS